MNRLGKLCLLQSLLMLCLTLSSAAQNVPGTEPTLRPLFGWPYASPHAPRIGGASEDGGEKVRLEIGGSIPLYRQMQGDSAAAGVPTPGLELGADFFTWSRLRSDPDFKFPVEAIDYYFGLYGGYALGDVADFRLLADLRIAHISAHLVDGERRFATTGFRPFVYSREFVDAALTLHRDLAPRVRDGVRDGRTIYRGRLRGTLGTRALFHTLPENLGRITPSLSLDGAYQVLEQFPLTLQAGYRIALNNEYAPVLEHSIRCGLKFAELGGNSITLEGSYYRGRSTYGQYSSEMEEYGGVGFTLGR